MIEETVVLLPEMLFSSFDFRIEFVSKLRQSFSFRLMILDLTEGIELFGST